MIAVWCETINERVQYAFQLIFNTILKEEFVFCDKLESFHNSPLPKVAYCQQAIENSISIRPHGLLMEDTITPQIPEVQYWEETPIFFETNRSAEWPFDLFAAAFYLCTRFEEYSSNEKDTHGRYTGNDSSAVLNRFLSKPIIDIWAMKLKEKLSHDFPDYSFTQRQFQLQATIDIDHPFAFRHKSFLRTTGGLLKALLKFNFKDFNARLKTILHLKSDPYDTYDYLQCVFSKYSLNPYYFVLLNNRGQLDSSVSPRQKSYLQIISGLQGEVGIHPSYKSNSKQDQLKKEIDRLKAIKQKDVKCSRQHFLKLTLPNTYRKLIAQGIEHDFSMGYAAKTGFRAGTCTPYFFFDLEKNKTTNLKVHPFAVMDGTLNYYQKLSVEEAKNQIEQLLLEVKKVEGTFSYIWHNETLSNRDLWAGWRNVFEYMNEKGSELAHEQ